MALSKSRELKEQKVKELGEIFQCNGVYVFDYRGLTVPEMEDLRTRIKDNQGQVKVFKNRLAVKYFEKEKKDFGRDIFNGPLAVAYSDDNFINVAKAIVEFEKDSKKIEIKYGFIEQSFADTEKIKSVAKLPSREQLLTQLAFSISSPLRKFGAALTAPMRNMLILMNNLKEKKEKEDHNNG